MDETTTAMIVAVLIVVGIATAIKHARSIQGFLGIVLVFGVVIGLLIEAFRT